MLVNLIAEMKRFGISPAQIAEVTGRSERAIKSRIFGNVEISSDDLKKIRKEFFPFYSLDYLLDETPAIVMPIEQDLGKLGRDTSEDRNSPKRPL